MLDFRITVDDAARSDVRELVRAHRAWAGDHSPPQDVHAVEAEALQDASFTLLTARSSDGALLGMGALRQLGDAHAELKAMHVLPAARGQGVGRALVLELVQLARQRGHRRVSRETSPSSVCMTLTTQ